MTKEHLSFNYMANISTGPWLNNDKYLTNKPNMHWNGNENIGR